MTVNDDHISGAENLLINCADLKTGDTLLIVSENPDLGWYDGKTADFVADHARKMGVELSKVDVGSPENVRCPKLHNMIENHDCTIFFSRIGDQDRFSHPKPGTRSIMCYIRDMDMLASPFGTAHYRAIREFKETIDKILCSADNIEISCPLGTHFCGSDISDKIDEPEDVGVLRFPLGVPAPTPAGGFSGRIIMDRYLAPTGSKVYDPPYLKLEQPIFAEVEMGRITEFKGPENTVNKVKEHYKRVSDQFGIDPAVVHSWHAGIHPGCDYRVPESDNPDRWSNTVFCQPEYVHFHTCGDYAPGEISCTLPDHSIKIDGVSLWQNGQLLPHLHSQTKACLNKWPVLQELFNYSAG